MNQVLNKVRDVDPNDSEAVKEALTTFFQNLSKHTDGECGRWLRTLENIINRFPKYCTSQRGTIETYLAQFLDTQNYYNVIAAAKCAHVLQQVKTAQDKAVMAKVSWREYMTMLCHSAHKLINVIFSNNFKMYKNNQKTQQAESTIKTPLSIALTNITKIDKPQNRQGQLCTRLRNVFVFIQAMLVEIYPVAKPVQPQIILEVILQSLTVSSGKNTSVDVTVIKIQALKTLDALVACLGPNLIPFSALVFRFVMQTLRWSSDNVTEETSKVRCAAYNSLGLWLDTLRVYHISTSGNDHSWQEELTSHLIADITPPKKVVQLTVTAQPNKHMSKKAKRKLANTMLQESTIAAHMPGEKNKMSLPEGINEEVAIAALECTETFLMVCGVFLKPSIHKVFQETLVRECYRAGDCALGRLRALEACRSGAPPSVPPPTHYCMHLYTSLLHSPDRQISKFCAKALLDIRLHLHCSPPSLNFTLEALPDQQNKADDKQKRVSDRNRAVLEQLLGAERMPSEDLSEQIITIPDEPSNKRPRLDNDDDKISLSSESLVVSCPDSDSESQAQDIEIIENNDKDIEAIVSDEQIDNVILSDKDNANSIDDEDETTNVEEINKDDTRNSQEKETINTESNDSVNELFDNSNKNTEASNIFEAKTQMPVNELNDTLDQSPLSMEVVYDPNATNEKVTVLEKLDDENLPSTNDTDDIQITCGQLAQSSQDGDSDKNKDSEIKTNAKDVEVNDNVPKVNGIDKSPEKNSDVVEETNITAKIALSNDAITVEDMLADFVDEVKDDKIEANIM